MAKNKLNNFDGLFVSEETASANGAHQLSNTASLTQLATTIAGVVFENAMTSEDEVTQILIGSSKHSHDAMDTLIAKHYDLEEVEIDFLLHVPADELERMLRSQQSKRSRLKAKEMTRDNYTGMMVGAVAEALLRRASGKPKSHGVGGHTTTAEYTDEQLEELASDQEALKKAIRNVQSKKSIMKSKQGFTEDSDKWQLLLTIESQLKGLRTTTTATVSKEAQEALERNKQLQAALDTANLEEMSQEEAFKLLEEAKEMLAGR